MYRTQPDGESTAPFLPLDTLRRRGVKAPRLDDDSFAIVSEHLDEFAQGLSERERMALSALLEMVTPGSGLTALAAEPAEAALAPQEIAVVDRLLAAPRAEGTSRRNSLVLVMKATRHCNLRCTYCHSWREGPNQIMTFEVLARATHGALASSVTAVEFVWHGGETTLLPLSFFRKALWLSSASGGRARRSLTLCKRTGRTSRPSGWTSAVATGSASASAWTARLRSMTAVGSTPPAGPRPSESARPFWMSRRAAWNTAS